MRLFLVLLVVIAVVAAKPSGGKGGGKGKGKGGDKGEGGKGKGGEWKGPKPTKFQMQLWKLLKVVGHEPVDPNDLSGAAPKMEAMLKRTKAALEDAAKEAEELTKNPDGDKANALFEKLKKDVAIADQSEMQLLSDATKYMLRTVFNGMKGSKSCSSLAVKVWGKWEEWKKAGEGKKEESAESKESKEEAKRAFTEEEGKDLAKAGVADLKCALAEVEKMEKFADGLKQEGAIKSGEEFEHAMGKSMIHMARVWRSVASVMKGMHMVKATLEHAAKAKAEKAASKRRMTELDLLLALLD